MIGDEDGFVIYIEDVMQMLILCPLLEVRMPISYVTPSSLINNCRSVR